MTQEMLAFFSDFEASPEAGFRVCFLGHEQHTWLSVKCASAVQGPARAEAQTPLTQSARRDMSKVGAGSAVRC